MQYKKRLLGIFTIVILSFYLHAQAYAASSDPSPTPIDYNLSYPGLLPDHPLYFLKMARDNLMTFFIGNPVEKAHFMLLQSDQHVSACQLLIDQKHEVVLAHSSFADAQNYFEEALKAAIAAKKEGLSTDEVVRNLQLAGKKHLEVLTDLMDSLPADQQKQFVDDKNRAEQLQALAASLKP